MAQLGLVPPGAAMSIIRNQQSSPSAQSSDSEEGVGASPRSGPSAESAAQAAVGGAGGHSQQNASANTSESAAEGSGTGNAGTQSGFSMTSSASAPSGNANAAGNVNGAGGNNSNVAAGSSIPSINNNTNNNSSSSNTQNLPPGLVYPALHLHPLNDTFAPKQISLAPPGPHNRIRIGRQTNAKTVPHPNNGYFDSKVLSRAHAEVWSQDGKVRTLSRAALGDWE